MMKILSNILTPQECLELSNSIRFYEQPVGDNLVPKSFSAYALPETEQLLLRLTEYVSSVVGKELYPTYSYCRIYYNGATMRPHKDRSACEFSMSLSLTGDPWPLWFMLDKPTPISLAQGEAVLYNGLEFEHWREEYTGDKCTQVFLHWVDANGPHADWQYDRRPMIGAKETEKSYWGKS
jgi:alkylated DNA repair dioxygenase AlkB